ncbi:protein-Npi-phosphohistidine-sugar phosphotransferase [Acididesulfobacillus acetoxydans]|uniref:PTS system mannose-specific EIIBCA component n=1 Tax=Acididesulfobacillus acetoxydans TaxID=1561005 RepID=A0A8S0VVT5_9FIRM|nr:fructose PTS transporter subunit IIA [Acididesulfobacillus acetoxydans]CAA7600103.1 protein-Npi-phosphohistidine-sugar phosphotransferase [Acididesulfobacillus acetoxydans]CEJ07653.1 PTS system mannose-specific EIIBCA component [Acididesulfobacillus acetoxydans]
MGQLVRTELMDLNLKATDRTSVIRELTQLLDKEGCLFSQDGFLQDVFKREETGNTAVGFGVAIPHGKSPAVKEAAVVFGRSEAGIDWEAFDGSPVHTVFLLAVPDQQASNEHLKILAMLSRALINEEFRQELSEAKTKAEILGILEKVTQ